MYSNFGFNSDTSDNIVHNKLSPDKLSLYSSNNNRMSIFSSSNAQNEPFSTIVTTADPSSMPSTSSNVFTTYTSLPHTSSLQPYSFSSSNVQKSGIPWKCPNWMATQSHQNNAYMNFNGQQPMRLPFKRKSTADMDPDIKTKQLITDEKMAAQLNEIHLSLDYTPHMCASTSNAASDNNNQLDVDKNDSFNPLYPCSVQDIEEKLKRAQRITINDVVRKIQEDPILPVSILERFEKPCKALVLWQPPQRITDLIVPKAKQEEETSDSDSQDNNNVEFIDLNNDADMDLDL